MNPLLPAGVVVLTTRFGRYRVAFVPHAVSPLPGFRAWLVQAVRLDAGGRPGRAVRLTLLARTAAPPPLPAAPTGGGAGGDDGGWDDAA